MLRTNARKKQDLLAQCTRYEIEHKEIIDEMVGQARVQEMEAKSNMDVRITQAQGNLEVAKSEGMKEAEEIRKQMEIKCEERKVKVNQMANTTVVESEAQLRAAENNSKALIATAGAENNSTAGLEVKRKHAPPSGDAGQAMQPQPAPP